MSYINLTGDYGYKEYWVRNSSGTTVDATTADWHIAANETAPAINIFDSNGVVINGGEIWGEISQTAEWGTIYNHMATGVRVSNSTNTTIRNLNINGTWDGIRIVPGDSLNVGEGSSNGWLIEDVRMTNIRDDAIENDFAHSGTLRDSLLDGVFGGFGTLNDQSAHGVLTVDDSIIIMKDYLKDGEMTHGSPFKFNTDNPENNPDLKIFNTIIAVQDPVHNGHSRLQEAWDNLTESSGNYYLNLSDTPFPRNYPLPPHGFTILQGKAARDFLAAEKAKWLAEHSGAQSPVPDLEPSSRAGDFNGDGRDDLLLRSADGKVTDWLGTATGGFTDNWSVLARNLSNDWQFAGAGDFNGDGRDDLLLRSKDGRITDWLGTGNGGFTDNWSVLARSLSNDWQVQGTGDFNGDGRDDLLLRSKDGRITDWLGTGNGGFTDNWSVLARKLSNDWQVEGVGDFNGDGRDDLLIRASDGRVTNWLGTANGGFTDNWTVFARNLSNDWHIEGVGDFNGDGRDDLLMVSSDGRMTNWLGTANGGFTDNWSVLARDVPDNWHIDAIGDFNGDGRDDLVLRATDGRITDWLSTSNGGFTDNWSVFARNLSNDWQIEPEGLI